MHRLEFGRRIVFRLFRLFRCLVHLLEPGISVCYPQGLSHVHLPLVDEDEVVDWEGDERAEEDCRDGDGEAPWQAAVVVDECQGVVGIIWS